MQVLREGLKLTRVAEVCELRATGICEYVSRFQIAVDDSQLMIV